MILGLSLAVFVCGIPAALSFGPLADVQWFGKSIFDVMDYSVSNVMMPLGGIGVTLFAGWRVWPVIASQSALPPLALSGLKWSCRVLAPTAIAIILLKNL